MPIQCISHEDGRIELKVPVNDQRLIAKAVGKIRAARLALQADPRLQKANFDAFMQVLDIVNDHIQNGAPEQAVPDSPVAPSTTATDRDNPPLPLPPIPDAQDDDQDSNSDIDF